MSSKKEEESKSLLVIIPNENYNELLVKKLKEISKDNKICYVSLNKGYGAMVDLLEKNKINLTNLFFIDSITRTVQKTEDKSDCIFTSSPNMLTELSLAIGKAVVKQKSDMVFFDSLSTLLIYHKPDNAAKFVQNLVNKFASTETSIIFTLTERDKESQLFKSLQMFIDKTIKL
jgi:archaellum biogenesis ATPase FlaH